MQTPRISITAVSLSADSAMQFSVYGTGWGYRAYSIPSAVVCAQLGAASEHPKQLALAFELGRPKILRAVQKTTALPSPDGRVMLSANDF